MPVHAPLAELVLTYALALVFILVLSRIRIPPIVSFIVAGAVAGPTGIGLVKTQDDVEVLAEMGIVLLLFTVGLEFSLTEIRRIWRKVLVGGSLQIGATAAAILLLVLAFSRDTSMWRVGLFAGLFVALSSTAIVLKELGTLNQLDSPARPPCRWRDALSGSLHRRAVAIRADPLWPHAAVGRARSPGKGWCRHWCGRRGQPFRSAGALPTGRAKRTTRGVSPRRVAREHRHGLGQLAARDLDGAWRVPRRAGARGERGTATRLTRKSGRFATSSRDSFSSRLACWSIRRSCCGSSRIILAIALLLVFVKASVATGAFLTAAVTMRVAATAGIDLAQVGEFSFILGPLRPRSRPADLVAVAAAARCQHRDDGRDAGAARGRAGSRLVAGDQGQACALG